MKKLILFLVLTFTAGGAAAQSVQLSTYYPSPFGMYDRIRLVPRIALGEPCDPGTLYVENTGTTLRFCGAAGTWGPLGTGVWVQSSDNIFPADTASNPNLRVGIGTTTPTVDLEVKDSGGLSQILVSGSVSAILHASGPLAVELWLDQTGGGNTNRKLVSSGGALIFYSDVNEHMRITSSGNVGIGTTAPGSKLFLDNDGGFIAKGVFGSGSVLPASAEGAGARLVWYPRKAAFRVGEAFPSGAWDDVNIGNHSVAMGYNTLANGTMSLATGMSTRATGITSSALGQSTLADGTYSTALGWNTIASGQAATAMGTATVATGDSATAMGNTSQATGMYSVAMGWGAIASGTYSKAIGTLSEASGVDSIVIGQGLTASGAVAIAMGRSTTASGAIATSMGEATVAPAYRSMVVGSFNTTSGLENATAWVNTDPLFVIGNGADSLNRSNAMTVYKNGNTEITGRLSTLGGLVIETRTTNPATPATGQMWLCTDTGDATPCNGI